MKSVLIFCMAVLALAKSNCNKSKNPECYKGRLEIKGICSNYTIKLLDGKLDPSLINATWRDEQSGKEYTNVFALGSPCSFPAQINQGDEFYFVIDSAKQECNVCMAYYPTPEKKLSIRIVPACK